MSRKTLQHSATTSSSSCVASSLSRSTSSSSSESSSRLNLHTLVEPGSGKVPTSGRQISQSRNQECSKGSGMGSGAIVNGTGGGIEGQADDSSECEGDDADDEDDEPDVASPVKVQEQLPFLQDSRHHAEILGGGQSKNSVHVNHLTGQRKRSFDDTTSTANDDLKTAENGVNSMLQGDDEPDYPRKRVAKKISATTDGILMYSGTHGTDDEFTEDGQAFEGTDGEISDEDIENEEEEAIKRELEIEDDIFNTTSGLLFNDIDLGNNLDLSLGGTLEDLDNELFDTQWNEPHRFYDLNDSCSPKPEMFNLNSEGDLFSAGPSNQVTPDNAPRQSFSVPAITATKQNSHLGLSGGDTGSSEDDSSSDTFFFEEDVSLNRHVVSTQGGKGGWSEETDDDADLLQYFFSSNSSVEGDSSDDSEINSSGNDSGGETTDEEEGLPTPTARQRSTISPMTSNRPQVIHVGNDANPSSDGPRLCSWIADPSRPICVIEGSKTTILLPEPSKRFSVAEASESSASHSLAPLYESESEQSSVQGIFDPTLGGLMDTEGGVLNGSDILGPPEAFYPYITEGGFVIGDIGSTEEDLDEAEAGLALEDFLLSDGYEDEVEDNNDFPQGGESEDEEEMVPNGESSADMLSRWDKVSVTAFRKRQIQHSQKLLQGQHKPKGVDGKLMDTLVATPSKKRRLRGRFLNHRGGFNAAASAKRKMNGRWG